MEVPGGKKDVPVALSERFGGTVDAQVAGGSVNDFSLGIQIAEIENQRVGDGREIKADHEFARHSRLMWFQFHAQVVPDVRNDAGAFAREIT